MDLQLIDLIGYSMLQVRGYWGDVTVGPFMAMGLEAYRVHPPNRPSPVFVGVPPNVNAANPNLLSFWSLGSLFCFSDSHLVVPLLLAVQQAGQWAV